jgi:hypothetical protein
MGSARLVEVFARIGASLERGALPIVVFDLDSTLFSTGPRNLRILREFAASRGDLDAQVSARIDALDPGEMGWNVADDLRRLGVADARLLSQLRSFWSRRFFTDEYVLEDAPVPGAAVYVRGCHDAGALIYYLTGRHETGMGRGTARALAQHGFPLGAERSILHLKSSFEIDDSEFKSEAVADIRSHGGVVVASFENEPGNANRLARAFPDALHFWLTTMHSPDAEAPCADLIRSSDFLAPGSSART